MIRLLNCNISRKHLKIYAFMELEIMRNGEYIFKFDYDKLLLGIRKTCTLGHHSIVIMNYIRLP